MKIEDQLSGDEIYLRTLTENDASKQYIAWLNDYEIVRYLEVRFSLPSSTEDLQKFIERMVISPDSLLLGIFLKSNNCHIGNIKLGPIDWNHLTGDIGVLIGERSQWGRGYATTAIQLVATYAFKFLDLAKITAGFYEDNVASIKAFKKAGFLYEGTRKSQWVCDKKRQNGILLGLVNPRLSCSHSTEG